MKIQIMSAAMMGMILLLVACTSTSEPDPGPDLSGNLAGVWVLEEQTDDGVQVFSKAAALTGNHPGYEFGEHGGLKVRKAGWCLTPPVTWTTHEGVWSRVENKVLDICHAWRGKPQEYQLEIVSLDARRLTCRLRSGP